jgi:predicted nucleic acid-binding Zn ribbon protein
MVSRRVPTPETTRIDEVIHRWLKSHRAPARLDPGAIFSRWKDLVGEEIGRHTRVVDLRGAELLVEVDSAALLNELSTYYRQSILDSVHADPEFLNIYQIRFRAGTF